MNDMSVDTSISLAKSVSEAAKLLLAKANLPKFQLERAIDPFLGLFLEEFVTATYGVPAKFLAAEFPIRKDIINPDDETEQSTNIDYAYLLLHAEQPKVVFVELKTDLGSVGRADQIEVYEQVLAKDFEMLYKGVKQIKPAPKHKAKYEFLREMIRINLEDNNQESSNLGKPGLLYLAPVVPKNKQKGPPMDGEMIKYVTFQDFIETTKGTKHKELWNLVRCVFEEVASRGLQHEAKQMAKTPLNPSA